MNDPRMYRSRAMSKGDASPPHRNHHWFLAVIAPLPLQALAGVVVLGMFALLLLAGIPIILIHSLFMR